MTKMAEQERMRVVIADDERPARSLLRAMLGSHDDVEIVGEAENGAEAIELIERHRPDLALLDLHMPEVDGLSVVRLLRKDRTPLVAFITAYEQHAVAAFEINAVDYLLKPVDPGRLREALNRAQERLERSELHAQALDGVQRAARQLEEVPSETLERIPVRKRDQIYLVPVSSIAAIIADGELLHLHTHSHEKHTIAYRLKDLEQRLPPDFVRLSRGTLVNVGAIERISTMPGGTYLVILKNGQELAASRIQSRLLREVLLKL